MYQADTQESISEVSQSQSDSSCCSRLCVLAVPGPFSALRCSALDIIYIHSTTIIFPNFLATPTMTEHTDTKQIGLILSTIYLISCHIYKSYQHNSFLNVCINCEQQFFNSFPVFTSTDFKNRRTCITINNNIKILTL